MQNFICFLQQKERGRASIYYHPHLQMISPSPKDFSCDRTQMHPSQAVAKNWDEHTGDTYPHFQAKYVLGLLPRFLPAPPPTLFSGLKPKTSALRRNKCFAKGRQVSQASSCLHFSFYYSTAPFLALLRWGDLGALAGNLSVVLQRAGLKAKGD